MSIPILKLLLLLLILLACYPSLFVASGEAQYGANTTKDTMYVLALAPFPDKRPQAWSGGPSLVPAVQLAVEHINNRTDVLPDYTLEMVEGDSGCNITSKTLTSLAEHVLSSGKPIAGIIGPGCSEAALAIAPLTTVGRLGLPQFTIGTTPLLNDHAQYPMTFGILSSSTMYINVLLRLKQEKGWNKLTVLYEFIRPYHSVTFLELIKRLKSENMEDVITFSSGISPNFMPLEEIMAAETRIVIVLSSGPLARRLMCLAFHQHFIFPAYQFVFIDRTLSNFLENVTFAYDGEVYNCTVSQMKQAVNGILLNRYNLTSTPLTQTTISNWTAQEIHYEYNNRTANPIDWAYPYYDAVWALALGINSTIPELPEGEPSLLPGKDYSIFWSSATSELLRDHIHNVRFQGVSGWITFSNETGHTNSSINTYQVKEGGVEMQLVAYYDSLTDEMEFLDGGIFLSASFDERFLHLHLSLIVIGFFTIAVALFLTITFQILNIYFYNYRTVKASSPTLNHFIFFGCYLAIAALLTITVHQSFPGELRSYGVGKGVCTALEWLLSLSHTFIFGTLCVKLWRLYRIFNHSFKPGRLLSNAILVVFVMGFVFIDVVLLTIKTVFFGTKERDYNTLVQDGHTPIVEVEVRCQPGLFFFLVIVYKVLLMIVVVCLSVMNRHIRMKNFKTTISVNVLVYSLILTFGSGTSLSFIFNNLVDSRLNFLYVITLVELVAVVFLCLFLLFFPPLLPILKDYLEQRKGARRKRAMSKCLSPTSHTCSYHNNDDSV